MEAVVLKHRHSLVGKSLVPVILKVRTQVNEIAPENLAKLKKDHLLSLYSLDQLKVEFEGLTAEIMTDVLVLCGKEENLENARLLLHFCIVQANLVGTPKGKSLPSATPLGAPGTSQGSDTALVGNATGSGASGNENPGSSDTSGFSSNNGNNSDDTVIRRMKLLENKLDTMEHKSDEKQVEECLSHVRILSSRPSITQPHVLLAAIETLVTVAAKTSHKEAEYYGKAFSYCKKFEDAKDFCTLVMKLFGSVEDKKIANVVADWIKAKKYDSPKKSDVKTKENNNPAKADNSMYSHQGPNMPYGYAPPFGHGNGNLLMPPSYYPPPFMPYPGALPPTRFNRGGRGGFTPRRGRCLYCKEFGHFVADCPKIKKEQTLP